MLPAGEEVRGREPLLREARAVGAAADDRVHRLDAGPPDRLLGDRDDLGVPVEHGSHVPVLLLDVERERRARLPPDDLGRQPPDEVDVLLEPFVVVVARDEPDRRLRRPAREAHRMDVPPRAPRRLGRERVPRERGDDVREQLDGVDEPALRRSRVDADAPDREPELVRRERLDLELAEARAVERVGEVGAEGVEVEVVGALADLLVDRERDARGRARRVVADEMGDRGHDRGDRPPCRPRRAASSRRS